MIDVEASTLTEWCGFLTDWDLCKYKEDFEDHVPSLPGRSVSLNPISLCHKLNKLWLLGNLAIHVFSVLDVPSKTLGSRR